MVFPSQILRDGPSSDSSLFWAIVWLERGPYASDPIPREVVKWELLLGIGLYYGVLAFNLSVTFWIGEVLMGIVGCFIFFPLTAVLLSTLWRGLSYSRVYEP